MGEEDGGQTAVVAVEPEGFVPPQAHGLGHRAAGQHAVLPRAAELGLAGECQHFAQVTQGVLYLVQAAKQGDQVGRCHCAHHQPAAVLMLAEKDPSESGDRFVIRMYSSI